MLFSFRETVSDLQSALVTATHVAKRGNPNLSTIIDWVNISCKLMMQKKRKVAIIYFLMTFILYLVDHYLHM